jgi:hypothetical protein
MFLRFLLLSSIVTIKEDYVRQAGLKPKSHSSGVYWIRADAGNGGPTTKEESISTLGFLIFWIVLFPIAALFTCISTVFSRISDRG